MSSTSLLPKLDNAENRSGVSNSSTSTNIILDALPYIDTVNPYYEEYAQSLIEQEMQTIIQGKKDHHPLVKPLPTLNFRTEAFRHAYQECIERDTNRKDDDDKNDTNDDQELFPSKPTKDTVEAWREAVKQARIAYEKERLRSIQLNLDRGIEGDSTNNNTENVNDESATKTSTIATTSASALWKRYNQQILEPQLQYYQQRLEQEQTDVATINHQRQTSQVEQYSKALSTLQAQYNELLQKQYTLKGAISNLENELQTE